MRRQYVVCYDISHPRRLRKVYKKMRGFGQHIQLSVFLCELSDMHLATMVSELSEIINHDEDQILAVDLGPCQEAERMNRRVRSLGRPYIPRERGAVIV